MCDTGILYYTPAIQTRAQLHASTHVQTYIHPDPSFTTNAEHLDCNLLVEHVPPCCFLTHIFYSGKYTPLLLALAPPQ